MYDASNTIISSNGVQQHQSGSVAAAVPLQRFGRDDRDVKVAPAPTYSGRLNLTIAYEDASLTTARQNLSSHQTLLNRTSDETIKSLTTSTSTSSNAVDVSLESHSLTSSLRTGVLEAKQRPTPSWIKTTAVSSALPHEDFNQLIDLHDFHYLVPQPVCTSDVEALILVHSAPRNHEKRQIIRETWASICRHILDEEVAPLRVLFLLGAVHNETLQHAIEQENTEFGDVIQGSFVDDYRNMTYKHVMAFKWFLYNCADAQILIKVDDDVYVNTPQLIKYLRDDGQQEELETRQEQEQQETYNPTIITINDTPTKQKQEQQQQQTTKSTKQSLYDSMKNFAQALTHSEDSSSSSSSHHHHHDHHDHQSTFSASAELFHRPQNLLFCQKITGSLVKRSYRSKWRVSFKEYSERYYPPYCPGYAIIYSPDVVFRLYTAAQKFKYFWIDDVHITGVLAQQTNTTITTSSHYVLYSGECERLLTGKTDLNDMEFLFAWHSISPQQVKAIWHLQMQSSNMLDNLQHYHRKKRRQRQRQQQQQHEEQRSLGKRLAYNISNYISAEGFR